jgi:hypothetical protein
MPAIIEATMAMPTFVSVATMSGVNLPEARIFQSDCAMAEGGITVKLGITPARQRISSKPTRKSRSETLVKPILVMPFSKPESTRRAAGSRCGS